MAAILAGGDPGAGRATVIEDGYGFTHAAGRHGIPAFEAATRALLAHRAATAAALGEAVAADPSHLGAHALTAIVLIIQSRADLLDRARAARDVARAATTDASTPDERDLLAAVDLALVDRLAAAADLLDARPTGGCAPSLLRIKLANLLRFQLGDPGGMARGTAAALSALPPDRAGRSYIQGCHAFALEELGDCATAERLCRQALAREPDDVWSIHALAHSHEMRGRALDGVAWLESQRAIWMRPDSLGYHSAWHLALFHLELGRYDRVLDLYDTEIRPHPTLEVRDVANGVGMLWRLRQHGVAVGDRWDELALIARQRSQDTSVVFFTLHYLMALLAVGDEAAAAQTVAAIDRAALGSGDQSEVARRIGSPLAHALLGLSRRSGGRRRMDRLARTLQPLGGSAAQRDLFVRTLAEGARDAGDERSLSAVIAARRASRPADRFERILCAAAAAGSGAGGEWGYR